MARSFAFRLMTYELSFHAKALKEWRALDDTVRKNLKARLKERLVEPRVSSAKLSGSSDRYKIKLKRPGVRLVYEVSDKTVTVTVLAVGKRERGEAYSRAAGRIAGE
ncbi:type II toxin-antitoxin system RelE/ParE family toxin [Palleronia sp. LCG004]|uniref:type II toxin-antitoxin system RelE family toxin n=1 Tax=Palleronia sp. LCG004 TaxID=3079304 RepID=UPI00294384CD|nr:type II toxin-antitoxin system RelE/ParE family toxin [Palleronia sp. LCG004]WOI55137.1 type II toxin-antitoxin system RelE/ParE family toxin [Palleronia sp. LCG004]